MFLPECAKATTFRKWITKALICRVACQHLFYPCAVLLANDLFRWKTFLLMKGTMGLLYVYTIRLFAKEPVAWFSIETTIYKGESRISKILIQSRSNIWRVVFWEGSSMVSCWCHQIMIFETSKRGRKFVEKEILIRLDDLTTFGQTK